MIRVAVIGYGYWGPNLVRNFMEGRSSTVVAVCDGRKERLELVRARYPTIATVATLDQLFERSDVDAVAIATPITTHFAIASRALHAGKHVWVEKPIAASSAEARSLITAATSRGLVLMVDHTFLYTGAVRKIRELVRSGELGELYYYDSVRVNLGLFQTDVNVMWDLAVHDLSIMDFVMPERPTAVSALAMSHVEGQPENVAYLTLMFPQRQVAHVNVNWLAPAKVRSTIIGGRDKMIVYNDLEPAERVKVYDRGVDLTRSADARHDLLISYRSGDMWAPRLDNTEALRAAADHFVDCISSGRVPDSDGEAGLRIVAMLEAAERSVRAHGQLVPIVEPV